MIFLLRESLYKILLSFVAYAFQDLHRYVAAPTKCIIICKCGKLPQIAEFINPVRATRHTLSLPVIYALYYFFSISLPLFSSFSLSLVLYLTLFLYSLSLYILLTMFLFLPLLLVSFSLCTPNSACHPFLIQLCCVLFILFSHFVYSFSVLPFLSFCLPFILNLSLAGTRNRRELYTIPRVYQSV